MMRMLIVIPAYNESESIVSVVNDLQQQCPQYDYIVINDGSKDSTAEICKRENINFIDLPLNIGLAGAVQTGMQYASRNSYDAVLQFDGDGQHMPVYIERLCNAMVNHDADIVIGSRFLNSKKSFNGRMMGSRLIELLILLVSGVRLKDPTSGMRLFNKKLTNEFAWNLNHAPEPDTLAFLMRNGIKVVEEHVRMKEREAGESYLNFTRSLKYMLHMCISILFVQWFRKRRDIT